MFQDSKVTDVMTKGVITVKEDEDLSGVLEVMSYYKISCVIVVDKEKKPVGVITETDITNSIIRKNTSEKKAKDIMCLKIYTIGSDATVREAAKTMWKNRIHRVFVVLDREEKAKLKELPIGIVAIGDIIRELAVSKT